MNRLFALILLAAIVAGGFFVYRKSRQDKAVADGAYTCEGCLSPGQSAAWARYSRGDGPEPKFTQNDVSVPTASALPLPPTVQASSTSDSAAPISASPASASLQTTPIPSTDSIPANPPDGQRFSSSLGPYQWYREGNLTWRINTATGRSCIIYATMEEWRKRIVLAHGCGRNA